VKLVLVSELMVPGTQFTNSLVMLIHLTQRVSKVGQ
jgi:hypothetical protein